MNSETLRLYELGLTHILRWCIRGSDGVNLPPQLLTTRDVTAVGCGQKSFTVQGAYTVPNFQRRVSHSGRISHSNYKSDIQKNKSEARETLPELFALGTFRKKLSRAKLNCNPLAKSTEQEKETRNTEIGVFFFCGRKFNYQIDEKEIIVILVAVHATIHSGQTDWQTKSMYFWDRDVTWTDLDPDFFKKYSQIN